MYLNARYFIFYQNVLEPDGVVHFIMSRKSCIFVSIYVYFSTHVYDIYEMYTPMSAFQLYNDVYRVCRRFKPTFADS